MANVSSSGDDEKQLGASSERLEPLLCPSCRGAVPLAAGETTACPYCSATVAIPAAYREMRDGARSDAAAEAGAAALFRAIGRPPSRIARILVGATGWIVALTGALVPIGVLAGILFIAHGGRLFGVQLYDVLSSRQQDFIGLIAPFALFGLGVLLVGAARRHAIEVGRLKAALAAHPPARPGGNASCRECGAALAYGPDDLGARCDYCGSENLVRVPQAYLDRMRKHRADVKREIRGAAVALAHERHRYRWSLVWRLILAAVLVGIPSGLWLLAGSSGVSGLDDADDRPKEATPDWREAIAGRPSEPTPCAGVILDGSAIAVVPQFCEHGCLEQRLVAMRRGDHLRIVTATEEGNRSVALPDGTVVSIERHVERWFEDDRFSPGWGEEVARLRIGPGHPGEFRAPLSGWYRVRVTTPAAPDQFYAFCFEVRPR